MGYYCAWGDTKMIDSSEEEGYENHSSSIQERKYCTSENFGETPCIPIVLLSDDTDRQFWAEDELSNSESRQKLTLKRKHRHSLSYRNRTTTNRSRFRHQSSNSSSDSITEILRKVCRVRKYCECPKFKIGKLQFFSTIKLSADIEESTKNKKTVVPIECQTVSDLDQKTKNSNNQSCQTIISRNNDQRLDHTIQAVRKARLKKMNDLSKFKQK